MSMVRAVQIQRCFLALASESSIVRDARDNMRCPFRYFVFSTTVK
jgi:hypothetical protein